MLKMLFSINLNVSAKTILFLQFYLSAKVAVVQVLMTFSKVLKAEKMGNCS
jgi:hypothetical protein